MKRTKRLQSLKDLHELSLIQLRETELKINRTKALLATFKMEHSEEYKNMNEIEECWRQSVTGSTLQLMSSKLWSDALMASRAQISKIIENIEQQQLRLNAECKAYQSASARCDAITDMLTSTKRTIQRHYDEGAMEARIGLIPTGWGAICE